MEEVGSSDPVKKKKILNAERIKYWISKGAQPSDSIHNLLISEKIIEGKKIPKHKKSKKPAEPAQAALAPTVAKPATETPKEAPAQTIEEKK